jgi:Cu+-exporting ATPase
MNTSKINIKVEGMDCANCALTITKYLQREGLQNAKVNFIDGNVSFDLNGNKTQEQIEKGIEDLGYTVKHTYKEDAHHHHGHDHSAKGKFGFTNHWQRFLVCAVFTAPLLLHMLGLHIYFLMNPYVQLILTTPVYLIGINFFGRSALRSALKGIPNMNVLIALGATAAYGYSLYGLLAGKGMDSYFLKRLLPPSHWFF